MVIPWVGYSLAELIKKVEPQGNAKYVEFVTLADPKTMPFVGSRVLDWPYTEGLRMDEAMHPLTLLAFGMYGEVLPNQNGAPVRLVKGLRGTVAAWWALGGLAVTTFAFLGVNMFLSGLHSYGTL